MFKLLLAAAALATSTLAYAHGMSAEDKVRMLEAGLLDFVELGAIHMITGYDHLLFLFGVMFFLTRFTDILKFVTAFTIGHSITLVLATLLHFKVNYFLIDAIIALTVCYKAFDNLNGFKRYLNINPPNLTWMVFAFGLIHGLGLATRLQQLPLGHHGLVGKILAFNVGVEVGQIGALVIILIVLSVWRKRDSYAQLSVVSNFLLMIAGVCLLAFQLHGYSHTKYRDEFPLNMDDHSHVHKAMAKQDLAALPAVKEPENIVPEQSATSSEKVPHKHGDGAHHSH